MFKARIAAAVLAVSLCSAAAIGAVAQDATPVTEDETPEAVSAQETPADEESTQDVSAVQREPIVQQGGAAGLVAAVVQAADTIDITDTNVEVVTIKVERSLNNLRALNNVLNNSPILSNNDIVVQDVIEVGNVEDVIAIGVLEGGDLILFTRN